MQASIRKTGVKTTKVKEKSSEEETPTSSKKAEDDKLKKKSHSSLTTPRNFTQKSSASDIYSQAKKTPASMTRAPKKAPSSTINSNIGKTPAKSSTPLKSTSSTTLLSSKANDRKPKVPSSSKATKNREEATTLPVSSRKKPPKTGKDLPFLNVTVNSPPAKKKLIDRYEEKVNPKEVKEKSKISKYERENSKEVKDKSKISKEVADRQRKNTRTLQDDEVMVLTSEAVDNNAAMKDLSHKLTAKPKAFYVDLDDDKKPQPKSSAKSPSGSELSYEDDFESYESDFESYQSGSSSAHHDASDDPSEDPSDGSVKGSCKECQRDERDGKDEESMLDSGNFELREAQKSANKSRPTASILDFIEEGSEDVDKKTSLTDEGFQDMSQSSAVSSMKTVSHVDVLDRPLFIDFKKSKENKQKRRNSERLQQRAKDLLGMIKLHTMSYSLYELKPIPYDLYMATFGRTNHTQSAIQTFDDGITEEVQTDEIFQSNKWTQFPVEFSKKEIHLTDNPVEKRQKTDEDYLKKFTFLLNNKEVDVKEQKNVDNEYKNNPLRIYFEQKDGAGSDQMLPLEKYETKLKNTEHNGDRLRKFLKRVEGRISNILTVNSGKAALSDLTRQSKLPFSDGYVQLDYKNLEQYKFLKYRKVSELLFSDTKPNILLTVHKKNTKSISMEQCLVCLWDISVASSTPLKILVAIDNLSISRFRGSSDGLFVSALDDGSIHLWDLSEEATILKSIASDRKPPALQEIRTEGRTQTEIDREWNLRNSTVDYDTEEIPHFLQACAYTSSALNVTAASTIDSIVGLELLGNEHTAYSQDGGRKLIGQVCSLQRIGILTIWLIIQEKTKHQEIDIGRAFWSKMKLEKNQTINLFQHIDIQIQDNSEKKMNYFNLTAAKRRLSFRKRDKVTRKEVSRQNSSVNSDRPVSAARLKNKKAESMLPENWECGILCTDLKVLRCNKIDNYLVAKNCGEVLCCTRIAGAVKVNKFCVTTDKSTITSLQSSPEGLPYFLAGTDSGTVHLCCLREGRVLLILDSRNLPPSADKERCQSDSKGRYVGTVTAKPGALETQREFDQVSIVRCYWRLLRVYAQRSDCTLRAWDLATSDIHCAGAGAAAAAGGGGVMAILTTEGEVQLHRLKNDHRTHDNIGLFNKYVARL
ncbi:unnamed protein product [Plutella xylostella]|uniref:(diamondback moth) hypothetical protein n=1 Tax=Plutella xylostella TaxID=51655 RepID=A0A8S4G2G4_PLUXY|nr:unnamed protein product [Plutella xylostella]